jgi:putative FmdB family regulatory protein
MPLYGYVCQACHSEFETLVYASDTPACPSCESTDIARQLSLIAPPAKSGGESPTAGDAPMCNGSGACGMCASGLYE